ncbi:hypothetical protein NQ176_g2864 [Zarea fungicola]|uniref:Uncharacterized protein n=1 Tax=Zarea fungicola TaxID=93591 RepID=A0ACC1NNH9_9HYPO|nr:hypothetical protein NQ176_g2864 [Lecanicillium fungicola]
MTRAILVLSALLLNAHRAWANNPISDFAFANGGFSAAMAAAPMWYMPSGTCMPSAAEDGHGHQTNGVDTDNCNINKLNSGCPPEPRWQGRGTHYANIPGEPFAQIPTYYNVVHCNGDSSGGDESWRIVYYVYFKKDTGHMSDWEGVVLRFIKRNGGWFRESAIMEQDGHHVHIAWGDLNDTFDDVGDQGSFTNKNRNHPKLYFGKFHHSVHSDWYTDAFKNTCPPTSGTDWRNDDYQFWARDNLRHVNNLNPNWQWGAADSPRNMDVCSF